MGARENRGWELGRTGGDEENREWEIGRIGGGRSGE